MKHKLTLMAVLLTALTLPAVAQNNSKSLKNPDEATYAITGNMQSSVRGGQTNYELLNPQGKNGRNGYLTFRKEDHHYGNLGEGEQVTFSLQDAKTDRPNKFRGEMVFWSWNDEAMEWQIDVESGSGRSEYEKATYMNFMLVLDCSGSMGSGLIDLKNNAKYFLQRMLEVSGGKGNVRVGVIGFSTVEYSKSHTVDPVPLNQDNYNYLCRFIDGLKSEGGTALYYSVNAAADRLQQDYEKNLRGKRFAGAAIVAFTDGHDNTSTDEAKGYSNSKDYYNYTKVHFPAQTVNSMDIQSWCVGKRGADVNSENIWTATVNQLKSVFDEYIPIYNMNELHGTFDNIATSLIERNTVLNLRVAKGISGRVGWTFPEEKTVVKLPPAPKAKSKFWLGLGLETGATTYYYEEWSSYYNPSTGYYEDQLVFEGEQLMGFFGVHADAAWSLSSKFSLGGSLSLTFGNDGKEAEMGFALGPVAKISFQNNSALLLWLEYRIVSMEEDGGIDFGIGWKFKSPWYIRAFVGAGENMFFGLGGGYSIFGGRNN